MNNRMKKFISTILILQSLTFTVNANKPTSVPPLNEDYFNKLSTEKVKSSGDVKWTQFGPGNSGYSESVFTHPTNANVVFNFPDMFNSYRSLDGGETWNTVLDSDLSGSQEQITRVYGVDFSRQEESFGMAVSGKGLHTTNNLGASWELSSLKTSGSVSAIAVDPANDQIWFAGSGNYWNVKANYRTNKKPHGLAPKNEGKLWRTADGGKSWKLLESTGIHKDAEFGDIYINPFNTKEVFALTSYGLYKSTDGGYKYSKIQSIESGDGETFDLVRDMSVFVDKTNKKISLYIINQIRYVPNSTTKTINSIGGIYRSNDLGNTWVCINGDLGLDIKALDSTTKIDFKDDPNGGSPNFVGMWYQNSNRGVSKYFDGEINIKEYPNFPTDLLQNFNRIVVDPTNAERVYIAHNSSHDVSMFIGDVWMTENSSKNNDAKWIIPTRISNGWEYSKDYWKSINHPIGKNVETNHFGDEYIKDPYSTQSARDLDIATDGSVFVMFRNLVKSTDNGDYWKNLDAYKTKAGNWIGTGGSNLPGKQIITAPDLDPNLLYMVGGENRLFQRTNDGDEYKKGATAMKNLEGSPESPSVVAISPDNKNEIYMLMLRQNHQGELRKSLDGGKTWNTISQIFKTSNSTTKVVQKSLIIDPYNTDILYFCISATMVNEVPALHSESEKYQGVYKSIDRGVTWKKMNNGLPNAQNVFNLEFDYKFNASQVKADSTLNKSMAIYAGVSRSASKEAGGLYYTKDGATTWEKVKTFPESVTQVNDITIDHYTARIYVAGGSDATTKTDGGVWVSDDQGKTWNKIFEGAKTISIKVDPNFPQRLMALTRPNSSNDGKLNVGIHLSPDYGATWIKINEGAGNSAQLYDMEFDANPNKYNNLWATSSCAGFLQGTISNIEQPKAPSFSKEIILPFTIKQLSNKMLSPISDQIYTAKEITPDILLKNGEFLLLPNRDYTTLFKDNIEKGIATVIITGKGIYQGNITTSFKIIDTTTVKPPVNPEDTTTVKPPVEPEDTTTVKPPVEPEDTTTVKPPVEPEDTTTVTPPVEPEDTTTVTPPVEPEDTTTVTPPVEPEDTTTVTPPVEPEDTTTVKPPVNPEDTIPESVIVPINPEKINVYPNPCATFIQIKTEVNGNIALVLPNGNKVMKLRRGKTEIKNIPKGVYFVIIESDGEIKSAIPIYKINR